MCLIIVLVHLRAINLVVMKLGGSIPIAVVITKRGMNGTMVSIMSRNRTESALLTTSHPLQLLLVL